MSSSPLNATGPRVPITVVVPTRDEEANVRDCLSSVAGWVQQIVVVDSGSSDRTLEIARDFEAEIVEHPYENAPAQWLWIVGNLDLKTDWILGIDADYAVGSELRHAIQEIFLGSKGPSVDGYYVRHRQVFLGKFIRYGGIYPRYRLSLFKRSLVEVDPLDKVDHRFFVRGRTGKIEFDLIEDNKKERDLSYWIRKQLIYAKRAAEEEFERASAGSRGFRRAAALGGRNERVLFFKRVWSRLPLYWRSVFYFLYRYFLRLGFLDGAEGLLYHVTQGLLFRLALDLNLKRLREGAGDH